MTWIGHGVLAGVVTYSINAPPVGIGLAVIASSWPDRVESFGGLRHRGVSHWPGLWIGMLILSEFVREPFSVMLFWFGTGSLLHLLGDMLTPTGIPLILPFSRMRGIGLFKTGSLGEMLFLAVTVALFIIIHVRHLV